MPRQTRCLHVLAPPLKRRPTLSTMMMYPTSYHRLLESQGPTSGCQDLGRVPPGFKGPPLRRDEPHSAHRIGRPSFRNPLHLPSSKQCLFRCTILGRSRRVNAGGVPRSRSVMKVAWTTDAAFRFLLRPDGPHSMETSSAQRDMADLSRGGVEHLLLHLHRLSIDRHRYHFPPCLVQGSDKPKLRVDLALRHCLPVHRAQDSPLVKDGFKFV